MIVCNACRMQHMCVYIYIYVCLFVFTCPAGVKSTLAHSPPRKIAQ